MGKANEVNSTELLACIRCGSGPCICCCGDEDSDNWAAHCMGCDLSITDHGSAIDYQFASEAEAVKAWNEANKEITC